MNSENPFEVPENPFSDPYVPVGLGNNASFMSECQRIKREIETYKSNTERLRHLQHQQMTSVSESEKQQILQSIDSLTMSMKSSQLDIKQSIEDLKLQVDRSDPDMVNQLNNLNRLFRSGLKDMIMEEDHFREAVTHQAVEQYQIINPQASYNEAQQFVLQNGPDDVFATSLEMQNKTAEARQVYENVKYRHDELVKIQEMAASLNQMFNDLQDIVLEQDEILNSANYQVNSAQQELEKGDANVVKAVNLSKRNRKCKWIILVLCIILAAIIAGVVAGVVKHFQNK